MFSLVNAVRAVKKCVNKCIGATSNTRDNKEGQIENFFQPKLFLSIFGSGERWKEYHIFPLKFSTFFSLLMHCCGSQLLSEFLNEKRERGGRGTIDDSSLNEHI
jgi:hypothetical protein